VSLSSADTLNRAQAGCSGLASPSPADNHWETTITGFVSPSAAKVALRLLDGRTVVAEPVASKELGVKLFGAWLPGCVSHANIEVEDAAAKVIASNPPYFSNLDGGEEPLGDHMPEDPKIEVRFAGGTPIDRRIQLLVAVERQGAQLYKVDGDRYLLSAFGPPLELIKAPLDEAEAAGLLRYSVTRA
jgi:hypothetical protein